MGGLVVVIIGAALGCFGFLVMRNPMRLALLAPGAEGYYQRIVLDRPQRISMRILGALMSLFGLLLSAAVTGASLKLSFLTGASNGLLVLLWVVFVGAWVFGIIATVVRLIQRKSLGWTDWFEMWKRGLQLGPIAVYPAITPAMEQETRIFSIGFIFFVVIAVLIGSHLPSYLP